MSTLNRRQISRSAAWGTPALVALGAAAEAAASVTPCPTLTDVVMTITYTVGACSDQTKLSYSLTNLTSSPIVVTVLSVEGTANASDTAPVTATIESASPSLPSTVTIPAGGAINGTIDYAWTPGKPYHGIVWQVPNCFTTKTMAPGFHCE